MQYRSEMLVDDMRYENAQFVVARKVATVAELSKQFGVSPVKACSDLESLKQQSLLKRNHGGAAALQVSRFDAAFQERTAFTSLRRKQLPSGRLDSSLKFNYRRW